MTIAIIYDKYHSEVVNFLLEIFDNDCVIFRDTDMYENDKLFKVPIKPINEFVKDNFEKVIVITLTHYFNHFSYYNHKFLFICHNTEDIKFCRIYNMKYLCLTPSFKEKFVYPFSKNKLEFSKVENNNLKKLLKDKKIILKIGWTLENNTDMNILKDLEEQGYIILFITCGTTNYISKHIKNPHILMSPSTEFLLNLINDLNIKDIILPLPKFRHEWSSSYAFAMDNNLRLHIPHFINYEFPNLYKYENVEDVIENFEKDIDLEKLQKYKLQNFERNVRLLKQFY